MAQLKKTAASRFQRGLRCGSSDKSFAVLLHGKRRDETLAAKAMSALRRVGYRGYFQKPRKKQMHASSDFTD